MLDLHLMALANRVSRARKRAWDACEAFQRAEAERMVALRAAFDEEQDAEQLLGRISVSMRHKYEQMVKEASERCK